MFAKSYIIQTFSLQQLQQENDIPHRTSYLPRVMLPEIVLFNTDYNRFTPVLLSLGSQVEGCVLHQP